MYTKLVRPKCYFANPLFFNARYDRFLYVGLYHTSQKRGYPQKARYVRVSLWTYLPPRVYLGVTLNLKGCRLLVAWLFLSLSYHSCSPGAFSSPL
jgi:hypothetical protein